MIQFIRFLLLVLPFLSSVAQGTYCTFNEIRTKNVGKCTCQKHQDKCAAVVGCQTCTWDIKEKRTHGGPKEGCYVGCKDKDWNCRGCGVWYTSLCNQLQLCLKGSPHCQAEPKVQPGSTSWIVLPEGKDPLVTTTDLLPGILEMLNNPGKYGGAFDFAQDHYNPKTQALALNSVRSRTMEQFHIHMCPRPAKGTKVLPRLDKATPASSSNMQFIPKTKPDDPNLWCLGVKGKGPIKNFVQAINAQLQKIDPKTKKPLICKGLASAAIIQDSHLNTWGCVSDDPKGPIGNFCDL